MRVAQCCSSRDRLQFDQRRESSLITAFIPVALRALLVTNNELDGFIGQAIPPRFPLAATTRLP